MIKREKSMKEMDNFCIGFVCDCLFVSFGGNRKFRR